MLLAYFVRSARSLCLCVLAWNRTTISSFGGRCLIRYTTRTLFANCKDVSYLPRSILRIATGVRYTTSAFTRPSHSTQSSPSWQTRNRYTRRLPKYDFLLLYIRLAGNRQAVVRRHATSRKAIFLSSPEATIYRYGPAIGLPTHTDPKE